MSPGASRARSSSGRRTRSTGPWPAGVLTTAAILALPVAVIAAYLPLGSPAVWDHLRSTVLPLYLANSVALAIGVGAGTLLLGTATAWLVAMCRFPGRRAFSWLLLLPLAMPGYIIAYTYTGLLDFAGPVQSTLRDVFGWAPGDYWFPEIRSLPGAIAMLTLVLYPYVYLLARAAFLQQSVCALDVGRSLGLGPWAILRRVALPLARPAIVTGVLLVLMETLADYGTVKHFGVSTFTTGIFRTWFGMGEPAAAAQLAATLLSLIALLVFLERFSRGGRRYHHTTERYRPIGAYQLPGHRGLLAATGCALPVLLGFALPALQLVAWSTRTAREQLGQAYLDLVLNSVGLAASTAFLAVLLATFLAFGARLYPGPLVRTAVRTAGLGYAVPGTVIAVGVIVPFAWIDNTIDDWARRHLDISTGLLLSGTLAAVIFAYLVRFLSVSLQTVEAGLAKLRSGLDETARTLGLSPGSLLRRVHLPMLRGPLLTAALLVFVDVMKELPATLILRPFDFTTLAVRTYELAEDEQLAAAAPSALVIALVGLLPVVLLSRAIARARPGGGAADA